MNWLRGFWIVYGRESAAAFGSAIAYVVTISGLVLVNSLFMNEFFLTRRLDLTPFFELLPPVFVFLLPAITMRLWSEERKTRTFEFLATLPLTGMQTTLGKFASAVTLLVVFLLGTLPLVFMLCALGSPDLGLVAAGYLGAFLLGAAFLSFGLFLSSLSSDQVVAFVASTLLGFVLLFLGHERVVQVLDGLVTGLGTRLGNSLGALPHYESFVRGLIELDSLVYFVGLTAVFLWLTARSVRTLRV